jgi:2-dehydro-3-deoxyglucarate aldolase/4-hydroxy-2-oxoheptanedioate aldolase
VLIGTGDLALSLGSDNGPERHAQACASVLDTCRVAGIPCAIFTGDAAQASARLSEGYAMAIAANDIGVVSQGFMDAIGHMKKT